MLLSQFILYNFILAEYIIIPSYNICVGKMTQEKMSLPVPVQTTNLQYHSMEPHSKSLPLIQNTIVLEAVSKLLPTISHHNKLCPLCQNYSHINTNVYARR